MFSLICARINGWINNGEAGDLRRNRAHWRHCNVFSLLPHLVGIVFISSLRPSDAYMRQFNMPTLVEIMACRLFGAKPLSEPMLPYCQLDPKEHIFNEILTKIPKFSFKKILLKMSTTKWLPFCLGLNVLKPIGSFISKMSCARVAVVSRVLYDIFFPQCEHRDKCIFRQWITRTSLFWCGLVSADFLIETYLIQWRHMNVMASGIIGNSTNSLFTKQTSKLHISVPLWWESTRERWITLIKFWYKKRLHAITSSWTSSTSMHVMVQAFKVLARDILMKWMFSLITRLLLGQLIHPINTNKKTQSKATSCAYIRADSRFVPSQWETVLLCNDISHCLGASLESALYLMKYALYTEVKPASACVDLRTFQYIRPFFYFSSIEFDKAEIFIEII